MKKRIVSMVALFLVLCYAVVALGEENVKVITTKLIFDGQIYDNTTRVTWEEEYPIPEASIVWDGTDDYIHVDYPTSADQLDFNWDGIYPFIKNQLIFYAEQGETIGAEFNNIQKYLATQNIRIIGYVAAIAYYQVETTEPINYTDLLDLKEKLDSNPQIISGTTQISYLYPISNNFEESSVSVDRKHGKEKTAEQSLWLGDILNENNPDGKNWGVEFIQAPSAWQYDSISYPINVTVFDEGFNDHVDYPNYTPITPMIESEELGYHGTHVTGIITAQHDNKGVSGVFHNSNLFLQSFNFINDDNVEIIEFLHKRFGLDLNSSYGFSFDFAIIAGYASAVMIPTTTHSYEDKYIPVVVNCSFGYGFDKPEKKDEQTEEEYSQTLEDWKNRLITLRTLNSGGSRNEDWFISYRDFWEHDKQEIQMCIERLHKINKKFIFVQAAGNDYVIEPNPENSEIGTFVADAYWMNRLSKVTGVAAEHVIVVGGIGWIGGPVNYKWSNGGDCVDILAPGVDIWSTYTGNQYAYLTGTSMAAPHVSGAAAFVWSIDPQFTASQVKKIITQYSKRYIEKRELDVFRTKGDYPLLNLLNSIEEARNEAHPAHIDVTVKDDNGYPVEANVTVMEKTEKKKVGTTDKAGKLSFDLKPGIYTISFESNDYEASSKIVVAQSGSTEEVNLEAFNPKVLKCRAHVYKSDIGDGVIWLKLENAIGDVKAFDIQLTKGGKALLDTKAGINNLNTVWIRFSNDTSFSGIFHEGMDTFMYQFQADDNEIDGATLVVYGEDAYGQKINKQLLIHYPTGFEGYLESPVAQDDMKCHARIDTEYNRLRLTLQNVKGNVTQFDIEIENDHYFLFNTSMDIDLLGNYSYGFSSDDRYVGLFTEGCDSFWLDLDSDDPSISIAGATLKILAQDSSGQILDGKVKITNPSSFDVDIYTENPIL